MPSTASPTSTPMRCFISRAALLVKVTARICEGKARPVRQDMGDAGGENARLAGAGAGQHQHRALRSFDRQPLLGVQPGEIVRRAAGRRGPPWRARRCRRVGWRGCLREPALRRRRACRRNHCIMRAECSDSEAKGQKGCSSFIPFSAPPAPSLWKDRRFRSRLFSRSPPSGRPVEGSVHRHLQGGRQLVGSGGK